MYKTTSGEILLGIFTGERGHLKDLSNAQIKYKNGDVYSGMILKGKKSGRGFYYYVNGDIYDGDWDENLKNGKGTLTCKRGDSCKGEWLNDEFVSGTYIDSKGGRYRNLEHPDKP